MNIEETRARRNKLREERRRCAEANETPGLPDPSAAAWEPTQNPRYSEAVFYDLRGEPPFSGAAAGIPSVRRGVPISNLPLGPGSLCSALGQK